MAAEFAKSNALNTRMALIDRAILAITSTSLRVRRSTQNDIPNDIPMTLGAP